MKNISKYAYRLIHISFYVCISRSWKIYSFTYCYIVYYRSRILYNFVPRHIFELLYKKNWRRRVLVSRCRAKYTTFWCIYGLFLFYTFHVSKKFGDHFNILILIIVLIMIFASYESQDVSRLVTYLNYLYSVIWSISVRSHFICHLIHVGKNLFPWSLNVWWLEIFLLNLWYKFIRNCSGDFLIHIDYKLFKSYTISHQSELLPSL